MRIISWILAIGVLLISFSFALGYAIGKRAANRWYWEHQRTALLPIVNLPLVQPVILKGGEIFVSDSDYFNASSNESVVVTTGVKLVSKGDVVNKK